MAKNTKDHGSPELNADAAKLESMGQDAGPGLEILDGTTQDGPGTELVHATEAGTALSPAAQRDQMLAMMEESKGEGFEDVKARDLAMPQFKLLQSTTPQTKRSDPAYIPGAEEGLWYDVISKRVFTELTFVPCKFVTHYIEWDANKLGNLIANHGTDESIMSTTKRDEKTGANRTNHDTVIVPTATWFGIVTEGVEKTTDNGEQLIRTMARAVVTMSGTAQKISKSWISEAQAIKMEDRRGDLFTPQLYAMSYRLTSAGTKNDKGSWFLPVVNRAGFVLDMGNFDRARKIWDAAKEFHKFVSEADTTTIVQATEDTAEGGYREPEYSGANRFASRDTRGQQDIDPDIPF